MAATLEIRAENITDITAEYAELLKSGLAPLTKNTKCTAAGVFPTSCRSYLVCLPINGELLGAEGICPWQQNFNPSTKQCSSSYICPSCTKAGLFCPTTTSFTLCADVGVVIISNYQCPNGYYCNPKCSSPCVNSVLLC